MKIIACCLCLFTALFTYAQTDKKSVVIGALVSRPNAVLVLNPIEKNQGVLLPQVSSQDRIAITPSSPEEDGLIVFDETEKSFYYWKNNQWIKGLGNEISQSLSFDPTTHRLSLNHSSEVDLTALKEIPDITGMSGQYLFTDGTSLYWKSVESLGDITSVVPGQGLTGGSSIGDATLGVVTDNNSIKINGTNQLTIADQGVTPAKMFAGPANTMLATDGAGVVNWIAIPSDNDQQDLTIAGNILTLSNDGTTVDLNLLTLNGTNITDGTIGNVDLANGTITSAKILPGAANTVMTTDASGNVLWSPPTTSPDAQDLTISGNVLTLSNDGTTVDLSSLSLTGANISDGTVGNIDLTNGTITSAKLSPGAANTVMTTDASGNVLWSPQTISPDAQDLTISGNVLTLSNDGTPVNLSSLALTGANINDGTIGNVDLTNGSITSTKLLPGAVNTVMTTDGSGNVLWSPPTISPDAQDLSLSGNVLSLVNDATPVDLSLISASGQVFGSLHNLRVSNNSVTTAQVQNGAITVAKLGTTGVTDGNKLFTTDALGTPQLETKSTLLNEISASGDLSGTYPAPSVTKLQGNAVSTGTLGAPDVGKILVWNGTAWTPQVAPAITAGSKYTIVDPSDFINLRRSDKKDKDNMVIFDDNSTYVTIFKKDEGSYLIAPVQLPHGAVIEQVTLYYMDRDANNLNFGLYRKTTTGANENVTATWSSAGSSGTVQSSVHTPIVGRETVDCNLYSYRVVVQLDPIDDTTDSNDADQRIYAVKVRYLY